MKRFVANFSFSIYWLVAWFFVPPLVVGWSTRAWSAAWLTTGLTFLLIAGFLVVRLSLAGQWTDAPEDDPV